MVVAEGSILDGPGQVAPAVTEPARVPPELRLRRPPDSAALWPSAPTPQPAPRPRPLRRELVRAQLADPWGILAASLLGGLCVAVVAATGQTGALATALYGVVVAGVVYGATVVVGVLVEAARAPEDHTPE
jgi:hypothetical protein